MRRYGHVSHDCGLGRCGSKRKRMQIDLDKLISLGRDVEPPLEIALADGSCTVEKIHRLLPGRRLAAQGNHRGRDVFVKLFFGNGARRACRRDRQGVELLRLSGVETPQFLLETATAQPGGHALVFEFLEQARPIGTGECPEVGNHAALAAAALARLHGRGAVHRDANLDNFMVSGGRLYVVDGAAVRETRGALGEPASLKALAAFLAEYPPAEDHRVPGLLARYASERGWPDDAGRRSRLAAELAAARRRRVRRYLAKTERDCTEFHVERGWRRVVLAKRSRWTGALAGFAKDPQARLADAERIKNGRSATVFRLQLDGEPFVVKRYNVKSALHRVRRWFRHRSRIAWRNGHRLAFLGVPGAEPVALIERRRGPLRAESWLVMPDCGPRDIQAEVETRGWADDLLDRVVWIFRDLRTAGLYHGDTKASNFLVQDGVVHLIDLDGMRESPRYAADVARFLRNFDGQALAEVQARLAAEGLLDSGE